MLMHMNPVRVLDGLALSTLDHEHLYVVQRGVGGVGFYFA